MKKLFSVLGRAVAIGALGLFILSCPGVTHASGSLTANQTVANLGVNDQSDVTTPTQANVADTNASRTLTVSGIPTASTTSTIGSCVVTYSTTVSGTTNCSGNAVIINVASNNNVNLIASALRALTNISDNVNGHGALTASGSVSQATFTTTGTEASSSPINFVDGTSGIIYSSASTTGVVPKAQVNTITVGGTVEHGDVFSITVPSGIVTYTTQVGDSTLTNIASGIGAALVATSTYSSQPYTVATSTNTVILTAKTAGTGFTQTSATTNATPVAQVVTFTPSGIGGLENYTATINGSSYNYADTTDILSDIVGSIATALSSASSTTCANSSTFVTCTAKTPGTAFTFSAATSTYIPSNGTTPSYGGSFSGGSSGGGGGGGWSTPVVTNANVVTTPVVTTPSTTTTTTVTASKPGGASTITMSLQYGADSTSVKALQTLLASDPTLGFTSTPTGYFGTITRAAVEAFQVKYGIVAAGGPGYGTVGPKTRKELVTVFGA